MSVLPIAPVYRPQSLTGVSNGKLPADLLVDVGPSGKLHTLAARAFIALVAAARVAGFNLTYTYGGTYRTYEQQVTLFKQRYTTTYLEGRPYKYWLGVKWYQKPFTAVAAVPGTSNHGWGLAIDTALDYDLSDGVGPNDAVSISPALSWLMTRAASFGFSWELQSEPWHIRYVTGDHLPEAVVAWEASILEPIPLPAPVQQQPAPLAFDPENGIYYLWPYNTGKPVLFAGCPISDAVRYLQGVLKNKAGQAVTVDGQFGPKTELAVRNLQQWVYPDAGVVDGRVGQMTWKIIDTLALSK